ncbi:DUF3313 family protein [Mitsuaria sp. GD03876]|jgi:hypothetical protein|uniref:DUF3313 family protein n=1 Tax=Mitsuaria sp. GD03876 TaxID=2975399 RepID=UPI00244A5119|nr:DUF3313 family protein [Mitsuaria sp. GD03876]MDH0865633.1 DUF3313 domain-containing protein [Mitsuaria sp. GD03876]
MIKLPCFSRPAQSVDLLRYASTTLLAMACGLLLVACASTTPVRSNHAVSYQGLEKRNDQSMVIAPKPSDLGRYGVAIIEAVQIDDAVASGVSADTSKQVIDALQNTLDKEVRQTFKLSDRSTGGAAVVLRVRITRITEASPALNALTTALVGPLRNGALAAELEAVDAETGRQLALMLWADSGGVAKDFLGSFNRSAHARALATRFATDASAFLAPLNSAKKL